MTCSEDDIMIRGFSTSAKTLHDIRKVTIIGAGLMGSGIAQVTANAKIDVNLVDTNQKALDKATFTIESSLKRIAKKLKDEKAEKALVQSAMSHIKTSTDIASSLNDADLVIEAIVENIDVKLKLFNLLEANVKSDTILTTNTSSIQLADIGRNLKDRTRFGGLHFFNPVPLMKLLEVVRHEETSDKTFSRLAGFGKAVGKTCVTCKDTPGFIVNRLLVPYLFEAMRLAERGDATFADIDIAMKLGAGYPMGPFELADYVGLDTCKFIMDGWAKQFPNDPTFASNQLLNSKVAEGKLGKKSGQGFYKY